MTERTYNLYLYTSEEEYAAKSATRSCLNVTHDEAVTEVQRFAADYNAYVVQNGGRIISEKTQCDEPQNPVDVALRAERREYEATIRYWNTRAKRLHDALAAACLALGKEAK